MFCFYPVCYFALAPLLPLCGTLNLPYHPPIPKKHVEEIVQRYAFPEKLKQQRQQQQLAQQLRVEEKLKQQQEQSKEEQKQQQGEETAQGRSREQAAGESAGEEPECPAASSTSGDDNRPDSEGSTPPTASTSTATPSYDAMVEDAVGAEDGVSMSEAPSAKEVEMLDIMGVETGGGVVGSSKVLGNMGQEGKELKQEQVEDSGEKQEKKEEGDGHDEQGEKGDEGLPVLLLRELASFRARFSHRVGKHLRADASENLLKCQVRVFMFVCLFGVV